MRPTIPEYWRCTLAGGAHLDEADVIEAPASPLCEPFGSEMRSSNVQRTEYGISTTGNREKRSIHANCTERW